ncbi:toxin-activating lysine-acyltransferase [Xanthomonas albilineans]|uniref:toxin-activating lysine-acyltransferase n=1 Tax=Xanthomonas albilineans TaxID=29447 RepID=UPI0009B9FEEE|nr:toxin-activating lysine-acyltransferase [Xanthomonas albilineans]PPU94330.1 toxin-activating lysine-acyltransferase [Xanthomonas albilineans]
MRNEEEAISEKCGDEKLCRTQDEYMTDVGKAIQLLMRTDRKKFSIAATYMWLWPAIRLGQIMTLQTSRGLWVAYATWAYLSPEIASRRWSCDPPYLHMSEWNEGNELWLIDFVAPFGNAKELGKLLKRKFATEHERVNYVARHSAGIIMQSRSLDFGRRK